MTSDVNPNTLDKQTSSNILSTSTCHLFSIFPQKETNTEHAWQLYKSSLKRQARWFGLRDTGQNVTKSAAPSISFTPRCCWTGQNASLWPNHAANGRQWCTASLKQVRIKKKNQKQAIDNSNDNSNLLFKFLHHLLCNVFKSLSRRQNVDRYKKVGRHATNWWTCN